MKKKPKLIRYENDLTYLHVPTKSDIVSIGFIVKVGSRDETPKNNGISHFLEHMLFKSTKKRKTIKLLEDLDKYGSSYNAMTTHDFTFYEIHCYKKDAYKLLEILIDLFTGANLYKKDIEIERGVIIEEYKMGINNLDDKLFDSINYDIFGDSNLGRPIIGTYKNIKSFTRKDLIKYRNEFYTTANTTFITIGDLDDKKTADFIYNKTKSKKINTKFNERQYISPIQEEPRLNIKYTSSLGQIYILLGFHYPGFLEINKFPYEAKIISTYLTSGSSSKLFNLLRTKLGAVYHCSSDNHILEDNSIFFIKSGIHEKKLVIAIEKILEIIFKLRNGNITTKELNKAKKIYINSQRLNLSHNFDLINHYAEYAVSGLNILTPEEEENEINSLTKSKIVKAAKQIFRKDNLNLVMLGDIKQTHKNKIINLLDKWYYLIK